VNVLRFQPLMDDKYRARFHLRSMSADGDGARLVRVFRAARTHLAARSERRMGEPGPHDGGPRRDERSDLASFASIHPDTIALFVEDRH
jgi:hypothetical protein